MQTNPTPYPDINTLLGLFLTEIQAILGEKLLGLYLFGSLVVGGFDYDISDIDLVAAIAAELDEDEFERLKSMQEHTVRRHPQWDNRIEIGYIAVEHLKVATSHFPIALMSPGEPFHIKEAGADWIINRYVLREKGIALYGPAPEAMFAPISPAERMQTIQENVKEWREWIKQTELIHTRKYQGHMILTMCRELYRSRHAGEVVSKQAAALWAQQQWPEWAPLIQNALAWRQAYRDEKSITTQPCPKPCASSTSPWITAKGKSRRRFTARRQVYGGKTALPAGTGDLRASAWPRPSLYQDSATELRLVLNSATHRMTRRSDTTFIAGSIASVDERA